MNGPPQPSDDPSPPGSSAARPRPRPSGVDLSTTPAGAGGGSPHPATPAAAPPGSRASDLRTRLLTATVAIPLLLIVIVAGDPLFSVVVATALAAGAIELYRAGGIPTRDPLALWGAAGVSATVLAAHAGADARFGVLTAVVAVALALVVARTDVERGFAHWTAVCAGVLYVGVLGGYLVSLRRLDDGRDWVLFMLAVTFATDTGAYAVGRAIGRRKLAPHISPGKTIAGAVGGLVAGALAAAAANAVFGLGAPPALAFGVGAVAAIAAQVGDLGESLLKRSLGVKDMGNLLPGHGGMLDRLDSILFVVPVVYYGVIWIIN